MPALIRWLRQRPCEVWFALASLLLSLPLAVPPFRSLASYANWTPGYYYINYWEFGFVKRGLLGTLISLTGLNRLVEPTVFTCIVHILGLVALSLLFWLLAHHCTRDLSPEDRRRTPWLYAVFLTSPALFLHFGFDLGRVDLFGLNITLLALLVLMNSASLITRAATALVTTTVGLLSHEAYLFFWLPLLGLGLIQSLAPEPRRRRWFVLGIWLGLIVSLLAILRAWGTFEPGAEELAGRFTAVHPSLAGAMRVELTSELSYNIAITWNAAKQHGWFGNNLGVIAYTLVSTTGYFLITRESSAPWRLLMLATPAAPLLMNLIAVDFIRHLSCAISVAAVASLISIQHSQSLPSIFRPGIGLVPLAFVLMGPLGIGGGDPLPLFRYLPF